MRHLVVAILLVLVVGLAGYSALISVRCVSDKQHLVLGQSVVTSTMTRIVSEYTHTYINFGSWPEPGTVDVDRMMPFRRSSESGEGRIDVYGLYAQQREVHITLSPDGTIKAELHPASAAGD